MIFIFIELFLNNILYNTQSTVLIISNIVIYYVNVYSVLVYRPMYMIYDFNLQFKFTIALVYEVRVALVYEYS